MLELAKNWAVEVVALVISFTVGTAAIAKIEVGRCTAPHQAVSAKAATSNAQK